MQAKLDTRIRNYEPEDFDACVTVFESNLPIYFAPQELEEFRQFLRDHYCEYLVAEQAGTVVACGGSYVEERIGRLCWGMVSRQLHRSSIGTALLKTRVARLFARPGVDSISLDTSQHTRAFFERFGFRATQVTTNGYGEGLDQVSMTLLRANIDV